MIKSDTQVASESPTSESPRFGKTKKESRILNCAQI